MDGPLKTKCCLIGTGNPLRTDDGAGWYCCDRVREMQIPGLEIMTVQQLQPELIPGLLEYETVIVADASIKDAVPRLFRFIPDGIPGQPASHHASVALLHALALELYRKDIHFYCCAIPAPETGMGEQLSAPGKALADKAVQLILSFLKEQS